MSTASKGRPDDVLKTPPPDLSPDDAARIARERFGVVASAHTMSGERDQNFRLRTGNGDRFILKIYNPAQDPAVIDFQCGALRHIAARDPGLAVPRVCPDVDGKAFTRIESGRGAPLVVGLFTFLAGRPLEFLAPTPTLRHRLGALSARLGRALRGYFHPAAGHLLLWDTRHAGLLRARLDEIEDAAQRRRIGQCLDRFEAEVSPVLCGLRAQVIHNDMTPDNILVDADDAERITGIIDFGDMVHSALINDLAATAAEHLAGEADPIEAAGDFLAGYHSVTPLEPEEVDLLFDLLLTRLAVAAVITTWRSKRYPENRHYLGGDDPFALKTFARLAAMDGDSARKRFRAVCGFPSARPGATPPADRGRTAPSIDGLLERRRRLLGPAYELFYDSPLHLVRGEGVWLIGAGGRRFLDAYNNVAQVGHCHPRVVEALASQAATLNTHTRYLDRIVLDYAERLTATFPRGLDVCMFVCTGSEANDLAWRLATAHTGGEGAIVTEHAYHGNTSAISRQSPEEMPPAERAVHVKTVPAPDGYRGPHRRGEPGLGERYARRLEDAIEALRADGRRPASFLFDSIFASDGILPPPEGYLRAAFERVRAAGGVCVADEVQSGFGRLGTHLWGFAAQDVVPDIVTLGKPMGNGHPLAAVITTHDIAGALVPRGGYFNTFGGNPVSCAVGLAVLDVLEREGLQENALRVGAYLRTRLEALADRHPLIGDVRGAGLFLGVELVRDRSTLEPATAEARRIINLARERGVLIGLTGPHGNVLKIRPPLVFAREHAEQLVEVLDQALREI